MFCLNSDDVSWNSLKQETIVDSTLEYEYTVASNATNEVVWINKFLSVLEIVSSIVDSI